MLRQIWIQCTTRDVKTIKSFLEGRNLIGRDEKIKPGLENGLMLIPTNFVGNVYDRIELADLQTACSSLEGLKGQVTAQLLPSQLLQSRLNSGANIIQTIVAQLVESLDGSPSETDFPLADLLKQCPNRWSVYHPMVLLPAGSFQSSRWTKFLTLLDPSKQEALWISILSQVSTRIGGPELTHLAVNAGIPLHTSLANESTEVNIIRSPSALMMLYGNFGPDMVGQVPTQKDFDDAFWVSTRQNDIYQTWAPRYTMFSRGNIKEKARLLSFHDSDTVALRRTPAFLGAFAAVDLYAGIGYFAFSYAKIGLGKVICWEMNPWSVEGLRRGARENGWAVRVVRGAELEDDIKGILGGEYKIIVFEESNERALTRMTALVGGQESGQNNPVRNVLHVNCGLLPSSLGSWETAVRVVDRNRGGWIHVHENVAENDIEARRAEIENEFRILAARKEEKESVAVQHVELVKTFAPGVWHCVFDVYVGPGD